MSAVYDEKRIAFIADEIAEAIEEASYGRLPWVACMARSGFPRTDPVDGYRVCGAPARPRAR